MSAKLSLYSERFVEEPSRGAVLHPTALPDLADAIAWAEGEVDRLVRIANAAGFAVGAPQVHLPAVDRHAIRVTVPAEEPA